MAKRDGGNGLVPRGYVFRGKLGNGELFSYIVGERNYNRIRVYERRKDGAKYVEWYDREGRHQVSLTTAAGEPIFLQDVAMYLADRMSEGHIAHTLLGQPVPHTLGELLAKYHADHPQWSEGHVRSQKANRAFWSRAFGNDLLTNITPAMAASEIRRGSVEHAWSTRTEEKRTQYLKDVFSYAQNHLKWISETHNMSALRTPKVESVSRPYTLDEVRELLPATIAIDLRCAVMAHVAWIAGRRATAIRTLPLQQVVDGRLVPTYTREGEYGVLHMPGATDKARKRGRIYVTGITRDLVEQLVEMPAVQVSGLLFPNRDLLDYDRSTMEKPVSDEWLRQKLRDAEELAEVENIPGRAYHGFKRAMAAPALLHSPEAASQQTGTRRDRLEATYAQENIEAKQSLASYLESLIEKPGKNGTS